MSACPAKSGRADAAMGAKASEALLSTAYLPPVSYFSVMAQYGAVRIEACENFQKQSYRTRARIASSSGVEILSVPILKGSGHKRLISEIEIDYKRDWVQLHERALMSYYGSAPFFIYYRDDIFSVLESRPRFLLDLNTRLTRVLAELLGIRCAIGYTDSYLLPSESPEGVLLDGALESVPLDGAPLKDAPCVSAACASAAGASAAADFRNSIHPKRPAPAGLLSDDSYYQVFSGRTGFIPDLSAVDLLFNEGPNSISFFPSRP